MIVLRKVTSNILHYSKVFGFSFNARHLALATSYLPGLTEPIICKPSQTRSISKQQVLYKQENGNSLLDESKILDIEINGKNTKINHEKGSKDQTKKLAKEKTRRRHKRSLSSKFYAHASGFEVNCSPYGEQFKLNGILEDDELKLRYKLHSVDDDNMLRIAVQISPLDQFHINDDIKELFVFGDGIIVYWNWSRPEQDQILQYLQQYLHEPLDRQTTYEEEETMAFMSIIDGPTRISHSERILLNIETPYAKSWSERERKIAPVLERFAFSHAMAASVKMGVWESILDDMEDDITGCIKGMRVGKINWKTKEALKKIGEFLNLRHSMYSSELLSIDFYWERDELLKHYQSLARNLCLKPRQVTMDKKLDYCEEMAKTIHTIRHTQLSHILEWLIIAIILGELVVLLCELFVHRIPSGSNSVPNLVEPVGVQKLMLDKVDANQRSKEE